MKHQLNQGTTWVPKGAAPVRNITLISFDPEGKKRINYYTMVNNERKAHHCSVDQFQSWINRTMATVEPTK